MKNSRRILISAGAFASFALSACASMNNKERGAIIGAGAGAAVGGVIGNNTGSTARGAIIGAAFLGILLLSRLRESAEGWRVALGVLAVFVLYSVIT